MGFQAIAEKIFNVFRSVHLDPTSDQLNQNILQWSSEIHISQQVLDGLLCVPKFERYGLHSPLTIIISHIIQSTSKEAKEIDPISSFCLFVSITLQFNSNDSLKNNYLEGLKHSCVWACGSYFCFYHFNCGSLANLVKEPTEWIFRCTFKSYIPTSFVQKDTHPN
jgi:hypothetical protein